MGLLSFMFLYLALEVVGDIHHLFASSYQSPALFALEYDSNTNTLTQVAHFNAHAGHPWMSFSFDKNTLYAAERDGWSSYHVLSPSEIAFQSNITLRGRCDGASFKHGTTNILAGQKPPYHVYGAGRSPCGNVISSKLDGSFERIVQNVTYKKDSRVYGMAHDPSDDFIYSADTASNGLWAHKVDRATGKLLLARFTTHPEADAQPRRLAVHPSGNYLYVVLSKLNKVAVYNIKRYPDGPQLVYTGKSFSLVPPGQENKRYRGSELALSANNDILYLTSRYIVKRRDEEDEDGENVDEQAETGEDGKDLRKRRLLKRWLGDMFLRAFASSPEKRQWPWSRPANSNNGPSTSSTPAGTVLPGYLTGLQLSESPSGGNGAGYPLGIILQVSTSTSGGMSSVISAAPWSNEHVTLADSELGLVQVWRFEAVSDYSQQSPPRSSGSKPQPPPNNLAPDPPLQVNPQSNSGPVPDQPWQPNVQPAPQSQPQQQQSGPSSSTSPKGSMPDTSLTNGVIPNLAGNQNLAHKTPPKGLQPPNPLAKGEQLPKFGITSRSLGKRQAMKNIRASIVSEWKAPAWAIGRGDPGAPRGEESRNDDGKRVLPGWGRGCCSHALWYD